MSFEPLEAVERRAVVDGVEHSLWVDPVALQALEAAARAGGTPGTFGALPSLDELPLRVVVLEARLEQLEGETWILKSPPQPLLSNQGTIPVGQNPNPQPARLKRLSQPKPPSRSPQQPQPRPNSKRPNVSPR